MKPLILIVLMVFTLGWNNSCTKTKISKEFSYTMEDDSRVVINIEYKPQSTVSGDSKFGSYYYIVQYFLNPLAAIARDHEKPKQESPRLFITFYDRVGYSLFKNKLNDRDWSGNVQEFIFEGLIPGINSSSDSIGITPANQIDSGWEWRGQFDESHITIENFRDIHSIKVQYADDYFNQ